MGSDKAVIPALLRAEYVALAAAQATTADAFRAERYAYWLEQAALMRADANEPQAVKCEQFAATWAPREVTP